MYLLYPISRHTNFEAADLKTPLVQNQSETEHTKTPTMAPEDKRLHGAEVFSHEISGNCSDDPLIGPTKSSKIFTQSASRYTRYITKVETHCTGGLVDVKRGLSLLQPGMKPRPSSTYPVRF